MFSHGRSLFFLLLGAVTLLSAACNQTSGNSFVPAPSPVLCAVSVSVTQVQSGSGCPAAGSASPAASVGASPTPTPASGAASTLTVKVTFYDQESSGTVTFDGTTPGGSGTYTDPITLATDYTELPDNTIVYVKGFNKYYIHKDACVACTADWANRVYHFDLWVGTDPATGVGTDPGNCAILWGVLQLPVIINAPAGLTVSTQPIETSAGQCFTLPSPLPTS